MLAGHVGVISSQPPGVRQRVSEVALGLVEVCSGERHPLLHPREEAVLRHLPLPRLEPLERLVQRQDLVALHLNRRVCLAQGGLFPAASSLHRGALAVPVDQQLPHRAGADGEEVGPAFGSQRAAAGELEVDLVHTSAVALRVSLECRSRAAAMRRSSS